MVRRVNSSFSAVESVFLSLKDVSKSDADSLYKIYLEQIKEKGFENLLVSVCLDNCNTMRGEFHSFMTKIQERKPLLEFPP